ncbi:hypothetical protein OH76DRAFT_1412971 [Lentinus brumalis]|uniref:Uncharacterized protein n=1 Tax=Lentinus brumalis TaxID=2498619 RepID=A0A371CJJ7_9APHY|nr:hypothetical protein OH76DRAFT_1412971 [Polyporus brumalis]
MSRSWTLFCLSRWYLASLLTSSVLTRLDLKVVVKAQISIGFVVYCLWWSATGRSPDTGASYGTLASTRNALSKSFTPSAYIEAQVCRLRGFICLASHIAQVRLMDALHPLPAGPSTRSLFVTLPPRLRSAMQRCSSSMKLLPSLL